MLATRERRWEQSSYKPQEPNTPAALYHLEALTQDPQPSWTWEPPAVMVPWFSGDCGACSQPRVHTPAVPDLLCPGRSFCAFFSASTPCHVPWAPWSTSLRHRYHHSARQGCSPPGALALSSITIKRCWKSYVSVPRKISTSPEHM